MNRAITISQNAVSPQVVRYHNSPQIVRYNNRPKIVSVVVARPVVGEPLLNTDGEELLNTDGSTLFNA